MALEAEDQSVLEHVARPANWVPVEDRRAGVDSRMLPYAIVVAVIGLLLGGIIPLIDDAVGYDNELAAGEVLDLGSGVTIDPPDGWQLVRGFRAGDETLTPRALSGRTLVSSGATRFLIIADPFDGSPEQLLEQVNTTADLDASAFTVSSDPSSITTTGGRTGVVEQFSGIGEEGLIAAFVIPAFGDQIPQNTGITVTATAPDGELDGAVARFEQMVRSLTFTELP